MQLTNSDAPTTYSVTNNTGFAIPDLQWVNRVINVSGTGFNANQLTSVLPRSIKQFAKILFRE